MSDLVLIGKIISAYGINGFVRIKSFSDFPDRFFDLNKIFIDFFGNKKEISVQNVNFVKDFFILKLKYFDSEDDVQVLIGKEIFVDEENITPLPEDHFFIHDLIDSKVFRNNKFFGVVTEIINTPANDVIVIKDINNKEILLPAVEEFVQNFDPENKKLTLKPGEDFYDDDEN